MKPLNKMPEHVQQLCDNLSLGNPINTLQPVKGGFHHRVWRLSTTCGYFAIKQLSAETDIHNPHVVEHYNATESIAEAFSTLHIATIHALNHAGTYLQTINENGYLVYPWSDARKLQSGELSAVHRLKMAELIAHLHQINLQISPPLPQASDKSADRTLADLISLAIELGVPHAKELQERLPEFMQITDKQHAAVPQLAQHTVISHGDLDPKNVLWKNAEEPVLIDWESACRLNPTYEVLQAALDWSGLINKVDIEQCRQFLCTYQQAGGVIDQTILSAAFDAIVGEWVNWLTFNIARSVDHDTELQQLGCDQIALILPVLNQLRQLSALDFLQDDVC